MIDMLVDELDEAADIEAVHQVEALGAETYWGTWSGQLQAVPRFAATDRRRVPGPLDELGSEVGVRDRR